MDEMMRGQRGWRELAILGDKIDKVSGVLEGLIWSPRGGEVKRGEFSNHADDWSSEEVILQQTLYRLHLAMTLTFSFCIFVMHHNMKKHKTASYTECPADDVNKHANIT